MFRQIFKTALYLAWRHKLLWVFGFFAGFAGIANIYEFVFKNFSNLPETALNRLTAFSQSMAYSLSWDSLQQSFFAAPAKFLLSLVILILLLLIIIFFIWLIVVSQAALLLVIKKIQEKEPVIYKECWQEAKNFFWRLFSLNLINKLLAVALVNVPLVFLTFAISRQASYQNIFFFIFYLLTAILIIIISTILIYSIIAVLAKNQNIRLALQNSWSLFCAHWTKSICMGFFLFLIQAVMLFLFYIIFLIFKLPLDFLSLLAFSAGFASSGQILTILSSGIFFILLLLISCFLVVFQYASWYLLFIQLAKQKK